MFVYLYVYSLYTQLPSILLGRPATSCLENTKRLCICRIFDLCCCHMIGLDNCINVAVVQMFLIRWSVYVLYTVCVFVGIYVCVCKMKLKELINPHKSAPITSVRWM